MKWRIACLIIVFAVAACETEQGYRGPPLNPDDLATISGAPKVTMGVPIKAVIRKIDNQVMRFGYSSVQVLPGRHELLVDCVMANHAAVRFPITVEVRRRHRYVLVAQSAAGNQSCEDVTVEER
jgi:hypothetical protein